jgi:hypothetical protein
VPLSFRDLEKAVEVRKAALFVESKGGSAKRKHPRDDEPEKIQAEASYLLLSNAGSSYSSSGLSDREQQRTGRWTDEEIAFVDYLVSAFDRGSLPLPHGIKLNEFLGDMLLCKSSRLTKKMKNAKLSTRSFVLCSPQTQTVRNDFAVLSSLQEKFLMSVPSEPTQLELRFNISKQWRTHFSNLCVQIGYPYLDGKEWIASLEEMERRASNAEEIVRKVRRRRMGLALQTDGGIAASSSVFIAGVKADSAASQLQPILSLDMPQGTNNGQNTAARKLSTSGDGSERQATTDDDMFAILDLDASGQRGRSFSEEFIMRPRTFSEDFDAVLTDLMEPEAAPAENKTQNRPSTASPTSTHMCGPFLDAIVMYMESRNLPFQHADVWVPSFLPRDTKGPSQAVDTEQLRLFHAGHASRGDLDDSVAFSLHEFGDYSDNFSFEPGHGLPGRVYSEGTALWESGLQESDPKHFERAGGAKVYGVKTAVGIPLNTPLVGRIVVAMYSTESIPEDMNMARDCAAELMKYSPKPKWKLVIEMDDTRSSDPAFAEPKPPSQQYSGGFTPTVFSSAIKGPPALQLQLPQVTRLPRALQTQLGGCTSPTATNNGPHVDQEEQRIVSLLGEHMPISDCSAGEPSSSVNGVNLLPHFMSIRLLLLRPASRRSPQENEMIDIIKNSFGAYSKDNRRSGAELANLLAKDWICLKSTFASSSVGLSFEHKPPISVSRQSSTGSTSRQNTSTNLMPINYSAAPSSGPMKPPSQFVSPPTSMGMFAYEMGNNSTMGAQNNHQAASRRNSSAQAYRRTSIDSSASRRNSSFDDNSQRSIQPHTVRSSTGIPTAPTKSLALQPNVVLEH